MKTPRSLDEMRDDIERERGNVDRKPFSHNIVSTLLQSIAKYYGKEEANRAIRDFRLKRLGWEESP